MRWEKQREKRQKRWWVTEEWGRLSQGPSRLREPLRDIFKAAFGFLRVHTPYQACLPERETLCCSENTSLSTLLFSYSFCQFYEMLNAVSDEWKIAANLPETFPFHWLWVSLTFNMSCINGLPALLESQKPLYHSYVCSGNAWMSDVNLSVINNALVIRGHDWIRTEFVQTPFRIGFSVDNRLLLNLISHIF